MNRVGNLIDEVVYARDPLLGNQRMAARYRRERFEKARERSGRCSSERNDRIGGRRNGGGFRSADHGPDDNWLTSNLSPDSALEEDRPEMISRADSAYKNFELGTAHVEGRVVRVAGCGMTIDPNIDFEEVGLSEAAVDELNKTLRRNWERTAARIGKRGEELWEIQHLMARYWERRREWFVLVGDRYDAFAPTTLKVEVIHPDRVDTPPGIGAVTNGDSAPWIGWEYCRMGCQLNLDMDVVGFYVRDTHPGDDKLLKQTYTYYPAFFPNGLPRMIHHFERRDEGQHRGYPRMQVGLKRVHNSQELDEAELEKEYVQACMAAVIHTDMPAEEMMASQGVVETSDGKRVRDIQPGMFHYVGTADVVDLLTPGGSPLSFKEFMEYQGRMFGAGAGSPYEMLTGNWGAMAYNAARIVWNMDEAAVDVDQMGHIKTVTAIYAHFVMRMVVTGQLAIDQIAFRSEPWLYCACRPIMPARASIDPAREDRNDLVLIASNIKPHSDMVENKSGLPATEVYRRIKKNREDLKKYGLEVILPNMGTAGGNSPTQPGDTNQESSDANEERQAVGA